MKIACLQFAPQVGDIDNNLNRADAVLSRANVEDLLGLDLLVLPELAFTGYNFHSLRSIAPFLEPSGSGISSLWARTTALRHDCVVVVGYPEKVDVTPKWPASPEYYNSALVVDSDGETIANYRKSFLYHTDETWALEGRDGFFHDEVPGVGSVAMGICMDINPYKFEASWDDFEFGWHVLDTSANVVILTMAWHTHHDTGLFSRRPQEPDLETLVYWVQRLEPLLAAKKDEEVIVVICNRTGAEDELMYAGTSAVLGIKRGEVFVYGLLGRGVKELLVVDTSRPPVFKLTSTNEVQASSPQFDDANGCDSMYDPMETPGMMRRGHTGVMGVERVSSIDGSELSSYSTSSSAPFSPVSPGGSGMFSPIESIEHQWPLSPHGMEAVLEEPSSPARLQFLARPYPGQQPSIDRALMGSHVERQFSPDYPDPTQDATTRHRALPKLSIPTTPWRFHRKGSPFQMNPSGPQPQVLTGRVAMTPMTAFDIESAWESPKLPQRQSLWPTGRRENTDITPKPQVRARRYRSVYSPESPKAFVYQRDEEETQSAVERKAAPKAASAEMKPGKREGQKLTMQGLERLNEEEELKQVEEEQETLKEELSPGIELVSHNELVADENNENVENISGEEDEPRLDEEARAENLSELSAILECLRITERRPGSAFDEQQAPGPSRSPCPDRPYSPKSQNASRPGSRTRLVPLRVSDSVLADRASSVLSSASIPISASPSIFDNADTGELHAISLIANVRELSSDVIDRPASRMGHRLGSVPGGRRRRSLELINGRSRSLPGAKEIPRPKMRASSIAGHGGQDGGRRPRSLLRFSMSHSPEPEEEKKREPEEPAAPEPSPATDTRQARSQHPRPASARPRAVSRGRQPGARGTSVERSSSVGEKRSDVSRRRRLSVQNRPSISHYDIPHTTTTSTPLSPRHLVPGGEDEIIAVITLPRRGQSRPGGGKKNPYDISLQPFASPPGLVRALATGNGGDAALASASSAGTFESAGPLTPENFRGGTTPEVVMVFDGGLGEVGGELGEVAGEGGKVRGDVGEVLPGGLVRY